MRAVTAHGDVFCVQDRHRRPGRAGGGQQLAQAALHAAGDGPLPVPDPAAAEGEALSRGRSRAVGSAGAVHEPAQIRGGARGAVGTVLQVRGAGRLF